MFKIGVISDTHGCFDDNLKKFLSEVDEIWHAGDIGSLNLADEIKLFKPFFAVYGNIDNAETRQAYPRVLQFERENTSVAMAHILGYPGNYTREAKDILKNKPEILVAGHSHILKIMYDKKNETLFINPGAAGIYGFHKVRTAVRFDIDGDNLKNMEIGEWSR